MPATPQIMKGIIMKKRIQDEMLPEYDFSKGIRGKYAKEYSKGTNVIVLDPDVSRYFPNKESVNESLRSLIKLATSLPKKGRGVHFSRVGVK